MSNKFFRVADIMGKSSGKACLVVGDIILDKYIYGEVSRISPEAPVPVVRVNKEKYVLGGSANVAGNIRGYHVDVYLVGLLGEDSGANEVKSMLEKQGIIFAGMESVRRCTTIKTRIISMNQQLVRIDSEDSYVMDKLEEEMLLRQIINVIQRVQVVVLSDYNKGVCSEAFCQKVIKMANEAGKLVIVDPKSSDWTKYKGAFLITPNFKEFQEVAGHTFDNEEGMIQKEASVIMDKYELEQILVTRSQFGMTLVSNNRGTVTYQAMQQEVFDVSGAGDTVIGTIAAILSMGMSLDEAVELSNYAAGLSVSKSGTYMVSLEEVMDYMSVDRMWYEDKVLDEEQLALALQRWQKNGEKIVFTNGCFDILHVGHLDYLNRAAMFGDKLIVGLNTDASVKRLKGPSRPVNNQDIRAKALAALQCVDAVVMFDEDTPEKLIKSIAPDLLVKGGDYQVEDIVGRQYAKEVCTIPLTEGFSTTRFIEKITQGSVSNE